VALVVLGAHLVGKGEVGVVLVEVVVLLEGVPVDEVAAEGCKVNVVRRFGESKSLFFLINHGQAFIVLRGGFCDGLGLSLARPLRLGHVLLLDSRGSFLGGVRVGCWFGVFG